MSETDLSALGSVTPTAPTVVAPPASPPPAVAPVAPPPATPAATGDELPAVGSPGWLKARLDRATEDGEKKARKELKAERRAAKAAAEEALQVKNASTAELAAAKRFADNLLSEVPEAERAAITAAAGGSVAKTLEFLTTWRLAKGTTLAPTPPVATTPPAVAAPPVAPPSDPPAAPAAKPPLPAPATTAPDAGAPPPAAPTGPEDHKGIYENLRTTNPYLAMQYLLNHREEIVPNNLRSVDSQGRPLRR